jgi:hypothetical protein
VQGQLYLEENLQNSFGESPEIPQQKSHEALVYLLQGSQHQQMHLLAVIGTAPRSNCL